MEAGGDGVRAESAFALVGRAGAGGVQPRGRAGGDRGAEDALAGFYRALPAIAGFLRVDDGTDVQEALGFLEVLPSGGFAYGCFVEGGHVR